METPQGFSETKKNIGELQDTAVDAAQDLMSTAAVHAGKARDQVSNLACHFQDEAPEQLNRVRASLGEAIQSGLDYVSEKPAVSLAVAIGAGLLIGLLMRSGGNSDRD
jgi:ElaB/YqjD/DUF883 family membrane-anchored ribosome-binding protein